jgi:hypothetical protein
MLAWQSLKEIEKLAAEDAAEDLDGEEEGILGCTGGSSLDRNLRRVRRSGGEGAIAGSVPTYAEC